MKELIIELLEELKYQNVLKRRFPEEPTYVELQSSIIKKLNDTLNDMALHKEIEVVKTLNNKLIKVNP